MYKNKRKEIRKIYNLICLIEDGNNKDTFWAMRKTFNYAFFNIKKRTIVRCARKMLYTEDFDTIIFKFEELMLINA
jgi:hypothetical protein